MKKIPIWKNIVLILSVLCIIIIATFAWFMLDARGSISDMIVHVGKATYIQVSGDGGGLWSDDLDTVITLNRRFKELSGNGSTLYAPVYEDVETVSGSGIYEKAITGFQSVGSEYYFEQTMDFRSNMIQDVFLSTESFVKNWEPRTGNRIDGAVRVALFELDKDGNETLRFIWAPNSKVEYSGATDSFTGEGTVEPYYYYQKSAKYENTLSLTGSTSNVTVISTADTDENGCGYSSAYKFMWTDGQHFPENAPAAMSFTEADLDEDDGLYYKTIKVKVWIEGTDRECVSRLSGEKFIVKLEFVTSEGESYE